MARVPLAPDKFTGTLTAAEVAGHLAAGIRAGRPDVRIATAPVADGGDGLLDDRTLRGKAPAGVAAAGRLAGVPAVGVAGRCELDECRWRAAGFDAVYSLRAEAGSEREALARPAPPLHRVGGRIAEGLR